MPSQTIQGLTKFVYRSRAFREVLARVERVAKSDLPILIRGESGVGKNLLAAHLHGLSGRPQPFVSWCMSQAAPTLAHGAIFGAVRGAYTGLDHHLEGVIDKARAGTLFIDEVDKTPMEIQAALLRLLDDGTFSWLGSTEIRSTAARLIFATNRDLDQLSKGDRFLPDLAHRLRILTVDVPALRDRPEDIPPLVNHLADNAAARLGRAAPRISSEAMKRLVSYSWPGNVREVSGAVINLLASLNGRSEITRAEVDAYLKVPEREPKSQPLEPEPKSLSTLPLRERKSETVVLQVLRHANGCGAEAARILNLSLRTFRSLQKRFLLRRKDSQLK